MNLMIDAHRIRRSIRPFLIGLAVVGCAGRGSAQEPGTFELGPLLRTTRFDNDLDLHGLTAIGARAHWFVLPSAALVGEVSRGVAKTRSEQKYDRVSHQLYVLRFEYDYQFTNLLFLVAGLGGAYNEFGKVRRGPGRSGGPVLALGARVDVLHELTLRVDYSVDWSFARSNAPGPQSKSWNSSIRFGVSWVGCLTSKPSPASPPTPTL